jgi:hypothetical protein
MIEPITLLVREKQLAEVFVDSKKPFMNWQLLLYFLWPAGWRSKIDRQQR